MQLSEAVVEAVVAVSDLDRAKRFYEDELGLVRGEEERGAGVRYVCGQGTRLFAYLSPENAGKSKATAAAWFVDDLDKTMSELSERGIWFERYDQPGIKTDERGVFTAEHLRAAWMKDPDGNTLSLTEVRRR